MIFGKRNRLKTVGFFLILAGGACWVCGAEGQTIQNITTSSKEFGNTLGIGPPGGKVRRLTTGVRVPYASVGIPRDQRATFNEPVGGGGGVGAPGGFQAGGIAGGAGVTPFAPIVPPLNASPAMRYPGGAGAYSGTPGGGYSPVLGSDGRPAAYNPYTGKTYGSESPTKSKKDRPGTNRLYQGQSRARSYGALPTNAAPRGYQGNYGFSPARAAVSPTGPALGGNSNLLRRKPAGTGIPMSRNLRSRQVGSGSARPGN